jgi:Transposase
MNETTIEEKAGSRSEEWRDRIAEQQRSGMSVKQFCKERGLTECSFYAWRKRLRNGQEPVRFALVEREAGVRQQAAAGAGLELVLTSGARLRIATSVDSATLRRVLDALRV